ncbi:MAG TPA: AraC family transcriptional regulator [Candidatus Binatia bacterium]|nr:AraC family transcriptional regulator [Candidatus Binatia bacterium]
MQQVKPQHGDPIGPSDWRQVMPFQSVAASDGLGWVGLEAARFRASPAWEYNAPALTHHRLVLVTRPPQKLDLRFEGVKQHVPPPVGAIILVPAGARGQVSWSGGFDWLHIYLDPKLIGRVAAEAFDLNPARLTVPPIGALEHPHLRAAMLAVDAELTSGGAGGGLAAESLANVLSVHLIRQVLAPHRPQRGRDGTLPQWRLRTVVEFIEEHLDARPTLEQMAALVRLNPYHFARQFRAATGLPPHQYVIARRIERARNLLRAGDLPLAEVAVSAGFSDQSQFSHHFKRLLGVTPRQFRMSARIA